MFGIVGTCFADRSFGPGRFGSPQTELDQLVFGFQRLSRAFVGQLRNLQMNGRDSRQALIVRVQRGGHGGEAGHQRINLRRASVEAGAGPEALDLGSLANDVSAALPHDKRRLADQ
jgi:hypothetical protein